VRGKAQTPRMATLGKPIPNAQELLRNFRNSLDNTARVQAELKQSYDDYVKKIGELDSCLSAAALSTQEWSGVGVILLQLSQFNEIVPQQVFVMGGRQQLAVQQVHTLTISLLSPHLAGSDKICVSTFVSQTHIQHHRVSCVCVCMCMCVCVCVYVCMCVCVPCHASSRLCDACFVRSSFKAHISPHQRNSLSCLTSPWKLLSIN